MKAPNSRVTPPLTPTQLSRWLQDEADKCRESGANLVALRLEEARSALGALAAPVAQAAAEPVKLDEPDEEMCEKLTALGWQKVVCGMCGHDGARGYPRRAAPVGPRPDRDAYEGAREDLLDWKRRALKAEAAWAERGDTERLDWLRDNLFSHKWNGVIGPGYRVDWNIVPHYRHIRIHDESGKAAGDFREAIDTAMRTTAAATKD